MSNNLLKNSGVLVLSVGCSMSSLSADTEINIETNLGNIPVTLYDSVAPQTVANFLGYVDRGDYSNVIFHRLVNDFVLQTGGFTISDPSQTILLETITAQPPVVNEFSISNTRATLAMAKQGGDPNSATSQWFINLEDNSGNLDNQNGGFTVFGIVGDMTVVDEIRTRPVVDAGEGFSTLPMLHSTPPPIKRSDLIFIKSITIVPEPSSTLLLGIGMLGFALRRRR